MLLDFYLNLPFTVRAALLAVTLGTAGFALLSSVFGPLLYGPDDDRIALQVEDAEPAFRTRLIAAIQLARPNAIPYGGSLALANATIAQAEQSPSRSTSPASSAPSACSASPRSPA